MAGEFIEVSGLFNANGDIQATRIEPSPAGSIQVHGVITNHNPGNQTFMIRSLVVDYSTATIDNGFPGGQFDDGDLAEVKGTTIVGGTLQATKVEPDGVGAAADDRIDPSNFDAVELEIEGFITRFVSASDFDVAGVPVTTTGSTTFIFDDGTTATSADIGLNVKVEAEGNVNASGTLVATKVKVRRGKAVRIVALVDDANGTTNIVTLLGIDVRVDAATRIEDKSNAKLEPFGVGDMSAGDYVEVRGTEDVNGTGDVLAARLERDDVPGNLNGKTELQGFVEAGSVMQPDFSILGVTINASGAIFRDIGGNVISQNAFFSQLNAGDLVKVKGTETSMTVIVADEVEFETP
ncbi:MAG TPA: hypothetical protein ENK16_03165 [Chromatiales bacterium]|nr:hypothetical protein [Chromatiales bacterium]